jgi:hypothetical protein
MIEMPAPRGHDRPRGLFSVPSPPWHGIVVGYTFRVTGYLLTHHEPPRLSPVNYHKVWYIVPVGSERWVKPSACLAGDLELRGGWAK